MHRRGIREPETALRGALPQTTDRNSPAQGERSPARAAASLDAPENADRNPSRTEGALLAMRELIFSGAFRSGERISELTVAELTGISRTPIRAALQQLSHEGFVEVIPSGGYAVRSFSEKDVFDAIEVRGALEGLAARLAAERGYSAGRLRPLQDCLDELDAVIERELGTEEGFSRYMAANRRLHTLILELADSPVLKQQVERAVALPFASPSGFVMAQSTLPDSRKLFVVAQDQHHSAVEAIAEREGARAERIMQEHSRLAARNLRLALRSESALKLIPGGALIRNG